LKLILKRSYTAFNFLSLSLDYNGDGSKVSCLVRVHQTLFYPVLTSYGFPQLLNISSNDTTSSTSFTAATQSLGDEDRETDDADPSLSAAIKQFQESAFVQDHPEIISGDHSSSLPLSRMEQAELAANVRLARFGVEDHHEVHYPDRAKRQMQQHRRQLHTTLDHSMGHVQVDSSKFTIAPPPAALYASSTAMKANQRPSSWLREWKERRNTGDLSAGEREIERENQRSLSSSSSSATTMSTDDAQNALGDDDYTVSLDTSRLVFKQCNMLSLNTNRAVVLDYCGKCSRSLFLSLSFSLSLSVCLSLSL
jgi:hypothetical protein